MEVSSSVAPQALMQRNLLAPSEAAGSVLCLFEEFQRGEDFRGGFESTTIPPASVRIAIPAHTS